METVKDLLKTKGSEVYTVSPEDKIIDAMKVMADKNIGALIVLKNSEKVVGIISERDYARNVALKGKSCTDTTVEEIMTTKVSGVTPDVTVDRCMALMTERRIRHLPVLEGNKLVGVISIGDIVKAVIVEKQHLIDDLEHYIAGSL
jgi:CBS domain-containing protein